ncbi:hypothetical protein like AT5G23390 [Hibiscus trionum]|uniref:Uncharacterized protein n=1 Tax=Hibiscus trionum TaxID=183268 RepID=A0A9W7IZK5_HIBTR|nr:hypothetical protein like AT5G23390 [Hibiscus trionum]
MFEDFCVGETHPLELIVKQSISDTGRAEAAQATVNQVKVEGIETNLVVMKELLFPFIQLVTSLVLLSSWKEPFKSTVFLMFTSFAIIRGWIANILALVFIFFAVVMLWNRHLNREKPL